jgi:hypothetical protein
LTVTITENLLLYKIFGRFLEKEAKAGCVGIPYISTNVIL